MSYTHYFNHTKVEDKIWSLIIDDCKKLAAALPEDVEVCRDLQYPDEPPVFNEEEIWFNGVKEEGHETFFISKNGVNWCKTAQKPYDLLVCACLIVYKVHSPDTINLSSDGDWEDWVEAMTFVGKLLGEDFPVTFKILQGEL